MRGDQRRGAIEKGVEFRQFVSLDQSEMPFGQLEPTIAGQTAQHGLGKPVVARPPQEYGVRLAPHPIEDNAGHLDIVAMPREPFDQGRRRGGHTARVHHQDNRQVEQAGEVGGRPATIGGAVEQAHDTLADHQPRIPGQIVGQAGQRFDPHGPAVQIDAASAGCAGVEHRIDVVRPRLERSDRDPGGAQRAQQPQSYYGLAAAGGGCCNDQSGRAHLVSFISLSNRRA